MPAPVLETTAARGDPRRLRVLPICAPKHAWLSIQGIWERFELAAARAKFGAPQLDENVEPLANGQGS